MSGDEWGQVCDVLRSFGPFDDRQASAYAAMLSPVDLAVGDVLAALQRLAGRKPYRPNPGEILAELQCAGGRPVWSKVKASWRGACAHRDYPRLAGVTAQAEFVEAYVTAELGEVAGRFAADIHRDGAAKLPIDDPTFGAQHDRRLREEWQVAA